MAGVFAEPYTPNPVPQAGLQLEVKAQLRDLERYLSEELDRIQTAMLFVPVQAAYGGLVVFPGPAADQPLNEIPQLITGWNAETPLNPNRVVTDFTTLEAMTVNEGGVYQITFNVTATVDAGRTYILTVYLNGVATPLFSAVDGSNQSEVLTFTFHALIDLDQGDLIQLFGEAEAQAAPHTFIMNRAIYDLVRISELHKDRTP